MLRVTILVALLPYLINGMVIDHMPIPKFETFEPSGIRVSLPDMKGITEFFFWANINVELDGKNLGDIQLMTYEPTDGVWVIEDVDVKLNPGDTIYYTFFVNINSVVHRYERQKYTVEGMVLEV
ncbi:hypothetical protein PPYR_07579 [Photinus pyralis]|uniref:CBM39 domain-containing protein n=1 Tax=Photinus pyralis TaxID=7054 RepID=A0A5N4AQW4_PHOPY|nr:hypothetical protein PPYR_07579 [Photinus pyralis]